MLASRYASPAADTAASVATSGTNPPATELQINPARAAGMTASAWLYSVPYHGTPETPGTSPRISRHSRVPTAATTIAALGPPNAPAATIGAIVTLTRAPPGIRTGMAVQ